MQDGNATPLSGFLTPAELVLVILDVLDLSRDGSLKASANDGDEQALIREVKALREVGPSQITMPDGVILAARECLQCAGFW